MTVAKKQAIDSPLGKTTADATGAPVGVVRMAADRSYAGMGELLQAYINHSDQEAWRKIKVKIDYTYQNLDLALRPLAAETNFVREIKARLARGQKLLLKPNLVFVTSIDPQTHGPDVGSTTVTELGFMAALMRWFHDKADVSYHQMCVGEASTAAAAAAGLYTLHHPQGKTVTTEAVIEGKSGDFYGGWGFYFVRKYLAESLGPGAEDDPMRGLSESEAGIFIPPGKAAGKLMVYDLNRISDDPSRGREIAVPDGVNFKTLTLHKAIVGGDPKDPEDRKAYPGCVLVNVPKLKVHCFTLFTNVMKNLGIGLYPMQFAKQGGSRWDYAAPHTHVPGVKGGIPHEVWVPELDPKTKLPKRNSKKSYVVRKTGGINATMIDIVQAVANQDIFMLHVVDGIEAINKDHMGNELGEKVPEGMVFAGLDPVATDLLCARYMFSNVPLKEALGVKIEDGHGGRFPQAVPIPALEGGSIVTRTGYDCPLARDRLFEEAERRGLGHRSYYVVGHDAVADAPLVSLEGHLGASKDGAFSDRVTRTLYFDVYKVPWDLQRTALKYMEAVDQLTGSSLYKEFLEAVDEDGDGVVLYDEFGKKGLCASMLRLFADILARMGMERFGYLKGRFSPALMTKISDPATNADGHVISKELMLGFSILAALQMSQAEQEMDDPFQPGLKWGKGKWPSLQLARFFQTGVSIYGQGFPSKPGFPSLYGAAFAYADLTQNEGKYVGQLRNNPAAEGLDRYLAGVASGKQKPLDFHLYVPAGFGDLSGNRVSNVEVSDDPAKILTVSFSGGEETWPEALL